MMDKDSENRCTFRGNLGRDPVTVKVNGVPKTTLSMAVNKTNGRGERSTLWVRFEYWRKDSLKVQELNLKSGNNVRVVDAEYDRREYVVDGTKKYWECFKGGVVSLGEAN